MMTMCTKAAVHLKQQGIFISKRPFCFFMENKIAGHCRGFRQKETPSQVINRDGIFCCSF